MTELLLVVIATATVNNVVLVRLLGLCPVLGAGTRLGTMSSVSGWPPPPCSRLPSA